MTRITKIIVIVLAFSTFSAKADDALKAIQPVRDATAITEPAHTLPFSIWVTPAQAAESAICENGYGSCGQWNPDYGIECPKTMRPCFHSDGSTTCELFPECQ